jgi:hypothetical protein
MAFNCVWNRYFNVNAISELMKCNVLQCSDDSRFLTTALPLNAVNTEINSKYYYTTCQSTTINNNQLQNEDVC